MNKRSGFKVSLWAVFNIPFAVILLVSAGLIGFLGIQSGTQSANDLANQLQAMSAARVNQYLDSYLATPQLINGLNLDAIRLDQLVLSDPLAVEHHIMAQLQHFPTVASIAYASQQRDYIGISRHTLGVDYLLAISSQSTGFDSQYYETTLQGHHGPLLQTLLNYDPTSRPWYLSAVQAKQSTWTPIFIWSAGMGVGLDQVTPVYTQSGDLLGVLDVSLLLDGIGNFLQSAPVTAHGGIFIVDDAGLLVASSTSQPSFSDINNNLDRLSALNVDEPVIKAAAQSVTGQSGSWATVANSQPLHFAALGQRYLMSVTPYQYSGLRWWVVVTTPESDFLTAIDDRFRQTQLLIVLALAVSIIITSLLARWITTPILQLNRASKAIAAGDWSVRVSVSRQAELGELGLSFNHMAEQLHASTLSLRTSEARLRAIFENSADAITVSDKTGFVTYNPAFQALFGIGAPDAGKQVLDVIAPSERARVGDYVLRRSQGQSAPQLYETRGLRQDGSEFDMEVRVATFVQDAELYSLAVLRDVTARKRAAHSLQISEQTALRIADSLRMVNEIGTKITSGLDLDRLLRALYEECQRIGDIDQFYISLYDDVTDMLSFPVNYENGQHTPVPSRRNHTVFGLTEYILEHRQTLTIPDTTVLPPTGTLNRKSDDPTRSYVGVPLMIKERVIGVLSMQSHAPNAYTPEQIHTLELLATQAAIAINNSQLYEQAQHEIAERMQAEDEIRHRLTELEAINKVSSALRASQTLDDMLPRLLDETLSALGAQGGSIWFCEPAGDQIRMAYQRGWGLTPPPVKRGEGIPGYVVASGQAYVSPDLKTDPNIREANRPYLPAGSGAAIPIRAAQDVIGALLINVDLPRVFTTTDVHLLTTLAEIAGNAIHRTRLDGQTRRRADQLAALHAIDTAISSSFDLHVTLHVLLDQVLTQLGVDAASVLLFKAHSHSLEYAAGHGFRNKAIEGSRLRLGEGPAGQAALERHLIGLPDLEAAGPLPQAARLAGEGFRAYYVVPLFAKHELQGVLEVFQRAPLNPDAEWLEFLEALAGQAAIAIDSAQLFDNLQRSNLRLTLAYDATIEGWSYALDLRDKETEGHTRRVTEMTLKLARASGVREEELMHIRRGALLHDIGKMGVPDNILLKPGELTGDEWVIMRKHPQYAYDMLAPIAYLRPALDIPYCHHEKWDGSGYPRGLKGDQIPLVARLFAVVDVWDALRSNRPYRPGWPSDKVLEHIRSRSGTHFDPQAVELFLRVVADQPGEPQPAG